MAEARETGERVCFLGVRPGGSSAEMGSLGSSGRSFFNRSNFLHRAAVQALRLGLVAQEQLNTVALAGQAEAIGQHEVAVLGQGDFDAVGDVLMERKSGRTIRLKAFVEAG